MNKTLVILIIVIMAVIGFLIWGQYKQSNNVGTSSNQNSQTENTPTIVSANTVIIKNFSFQPSTLTIKTGTTVTWENQDSAGHNIKSTTFNSQILQMGEKFQFTFNTKGTFVYNCGVHPTMTGTIIVE
jgi:plastocyanin